MKRKKLPLADQPMDPSRQIYPITRPGCSQYPYTYTAVNDAQPARSANPGAGARGPTSKGGNHD